MLENSPVKLISHQPASGWQLTMACIQRPYTVLMLVLAMTVLGLFAVSKIHVELVPGLQGEQLYVSFSRPDATPELLEREILLPLERRVQQIGGISRTEGEIRGQNGTLQLTFAYGQYHVGKELELQQAVAELGRLQPKGSRIEVSGQDLSAMSRFVMSIRVLGAQDVVHLRQLAEQQLQARLAGIAGVSRVFVSGGRSQQVQIDIDIARAAAAGISAADIRYRLQQALPGRMIVGNTSLLNRRLDVQIDGSARSLSALQQIPLAPDLQLQHVADVRLADAPQKTVYRINGKEAVGLLIFQQDNANLVQLGEALRQRIALLNQQYQPYGVELVTGFDAAQKVTAVLSKLQALALGGILIALLVLYLFMREMNAVLVVLITVPLSLLGAISLLYLCGYSLNVITLFGLTIGVGMLVDNSIVVYEAVQRCIDQGEAPHQAAATGLRRTFRAILAASLTNAVVFVPLIYFTEDALQRALLEIVALSILLPLLASLLIAVTVVPLLTHQLALWRRNRAKRQQTDQTPWLFIALLKMSLRRPLLWGMSLLGLVLLTLLFVLPLLLLKTTNLADAGAAELKVDMEFSSGHSLLTVGTTLERLEQRVMQLSGIQRVETSFDEQQATLTIFLRKDRTAQDVSIGAVRQILHEQIKALDHVQLKQEQSQQLEQQLQGMQIQQIAVSGPDIGQLYQIAQNIREQLIALPQISTVSVSSSLQGDTLSVGLRRNAQFNYALFPETVLAALNYTGREGLLLHTTLASGSGYQLPVVVTDKITAATTLEQRFQSYRLQAGAQQIPLQELTESQRESPAPLITHRNGQREILLTYQFADAVAASGPERDALQTRIQQQANSVYKAPGYALEFLETQLPADKFRLYFLPAVLLLFVVLAVTFESILMPWLVLLAVPLSLLGGLWALLLGGYGLDLMAMLGAVVLLGLAVNPAILLVDYMQQKRVKNQISPAVAAMLAVRERTRPVLMTAATTAAGLWPMALSHGQQDELWPAFATVLIGGVLSVTALTLLVIPVGYVLLCQLEQRMAAVNRRLLWAWLSGNLLCLLGLTLAGILQQFHWQLVCSIIMASGSFYLLQRYTLSAPLPQVPDSGITLQARYLRKIYHSAGSLSRIWHRTSQENTTQRPHDGWSQVLTWLLLAAGPLYLVDAVQSRFWSICWAFLGAHWLAKALWCIYCTVHSSPRPFRQSALLWLSPWLVWVWTGLNALAVGEQELATVLSQSCLLSIIIMVLQLARRRALQLAAAVTPTVAEARRFVLLQQIWDQFCHHVVGVDLPRRPFTALSGLNFTAQTGLIGILGPNGAGKSTFLRLMAAVLTPSSGTLWYGGIVQKNWGRQLADLIGYLPQDFGLYGQLTIREYLNYFALLYRIGDAGERAERVDYLLAEVGLADRQHLAISALSGGMQRRVGVARALLRLPPVVIVDEPTVGLDPYERIKFRNLLSQLSKQRIVLFSTHVIEDVEVSCDRVLVLKQGRLLYDGSPQALAHVADGKVWLLRVPEAEVAAIARRFKIVSQVQEGLELVRLRLLAPHAPSVLAEPEIASLEDGYLQLFREDTSDAKSDPMA